MEPKLNVTTRQVLNDLAFTAVAAIATGAAVGGVAFIVVRFYNTQITFGYGEQTYDNAW